MIIIKVMILNVEYIWLISLYAMQIKVSSAVSYDFNQLIYAVCALPWPRHAPPSGKNLPRPPLMLTMAG